MEIDGPDAAGKTTLADQLAKIIRRPVLRSSVDGWHHPRPIRTYRGNLSPAGYYRDSYDHDARVYLHVPPAVTPTCAAARDSAAVGIRHEQRYLPGQELYRREADPVDAPDIVLDICDPTAPTVLKWEPRG